ncbi:MAG: hypothetical protein EON59_06735 [Alphaproteobacteria bacterium]|nr:MAG: hypothetical protein EON59_06735 [Alphaproteobacteria bacterium]
MKTDKIVEVGIDGEGSLWVKPADARFPYIYREAMEVGWDGNRQCLFSPRPREWSYVDWFRQILAGAKAQRTTLLLDTHTQWRAIDADLKKEIEASQ